MQGDPAGVGEVDGSRQPVRRRGGRRFRPGEAGAQLGQRVAAGRVAVRYLLRVPAVDRVAVDAPVHPHDLPVECRMGGVGGVPEAGAGAPRRPEVQEVAAVVAAPRPVEVIGAGGHAKEVCDALEVVAVDVAEALSPAAVGAAVARERLGQEPLDVGQPAGRVRHVVVQRQRRHRHLRRPVDDAVAVQGIVEGVEHAVPVELAGARGEPGDDRFAVRTQVVPQVVQRLRHGRHHPVELVRVEVRGPLQVEPGQVPHPRRGVVPARAVAVEHGHERGRRQRAVQRAQRVHHALVRRERLLVARVALVPGGLARKQQIAGEDDLRRRFGQRRMSALAHLRQQRGKLRRVSLTPQPFERFRGEVDAGMAGRRCAHSNLLTRTRTRTGRRRSGRSAAARAAPPALRSAGRARSRSRRCDLRSPAATARSPRSAPRRRRTR